MFKKDLTVSSKTKLKSSAQRAIRAKVLEYYPALAPHIDDVLPKKSQLECIKLSDRTTVYALPPHTTSDSSSSAGPLFISPDPPTTPPLLPHLRLLHIYPHLLPHLRIDRGAIRFVLSGATLMAPGLTSAGGFLPEGLEAGTVVAVEAEGKEEICLVGVLGRGTEEIRGEGRGGVLEGGGGHYLGDGVWGVGVE